MSHKARKSMNCVTLSMNDLGVIAQNAMPLNGSVKQSKKEKLHQMSQARAETWGNTIEAQRRKKISNKKAALEREEMHLRELDEKEALDRAAYRQQMVAAAKVVKREQSDEIRKFKSKLMMADIVHQRQQQMAITEYQKEMEKSLEGKYLEQTLQRMKAFDIKEATKVTTSKLKQIETQKMIEVQLKEVEKKRKVDKVEKAEAAKQLNQIAAEEDKKRQNAEEQRVQHLLSVQKEQREWLEQETLRKAEQQRLDAKEDDKVREYAVKQDRIKSVRKEKEHTRFEERQRLKQKLIDVQTEHLLALRSNADDRVAKQAESAAAKKEGIEIKKAMKEKRLLKECLDECQFQRERRVQNKSEERREDQERLREIDLDVERYHKEEAGNVVQRRNDALKVQSFLRKQQINKKRREIQLAEGDRTHQRQITKEHQEEQEEISKWAKEKIEEYKAMGLDVKHLFKK